MWQMVRDACDEKWVISAGISTWHQLKEYCTLSFIRKLKLNVMVQWLAFLLHSLEVPGSNLGTQAYDLIEVYVEIYLL